MNNLNSILIEGNLTRDPELRSTPKGTSICTFPISSNRYFKQNNAMEKEVSFFNVETWAKLAEASYQQGKKGRGVRVVGRLKQERWNDKENKSQSRIFIVAEHVEFRPEFPAKAAEEMNDSETAEEKPETETALVPSF
jgi:single-strand DNA-binding protein